MYELLYKYLALYNKLPLPEIGTFTIENEAAKINFTEKLIHPSIPVIRFRQHPQPNENNFLPLLNRELQVDEVHAQQQFNQFLSGLKEQLKLSDNAMLPGIGTLTKQPGNSYSFSPETQVQYYLPDVPAERVVRKNASHSVKVGEDEKSSAEMQKMLLHVEIKKENWRVYALVLAVVGIAVILIYHFTH